MSVFGSAQAFQQTRHARRIYVGGFPPNYADEEAIKFFINSVIAKGLGVQNDNSYVLSIYVNAKKCFAFVELRSIELATACLELDRIIYKKVALKILRANEYKPELIPPSMIGIPITLDLSSFSFGNLSSTSTSPPPSGQATADSSGKGKSSASSKKQANLLTSGEDMRYSAHDARLDSVIQFASLTQVEAGCITIIGYPYDDKVANSNNASGANTTGISGLSGLGCVQAPKKLRNLIRKFKFGMVQNPEYDVDLSGIKIIDVGDVLVGKTREDTKFNLSATVNEVLCRGAIPFVVGGSSDCFYYNAVGLMAAAEARSPGNDIGAVVISAQLGDSKLLEDLRFCNRNTASSSGGICRSIDSTEVHQHTNPLVNQQLPYNPAHSNNSSNSNILSVLSGSHSAFNSPRGEVTPRLSNISTGSSTANDIDSVEQASNLGNVDNTANTSTRLVADGIASSADKQLLPRLPLEGSRGDLENEIISNTATCDGRYIRFAAQGSQCSMDMARYITNRGGRIVWLNKDIRNFNILNSQRSLMNQINSQAGQSKSIPTGAKLQSPRTSGNDGRIPPPFAPSLTSDSSNQTRSLGLVDLSPHNSVLHLFKEALKSAAVNSMDYSAIAPSDRKNQKPSQHGISDGIAAYKPDDARFIEINEVSTPDKGCAVDVSGKEHDSVPVNSHVSASTPSPNTNDAGSSMNSTETSPAPTTDNNINDSSGHNISTHTNVRHSMVAVSLDMGAMCSSVRGCGILTGSNSSATGLTMDEVLDIVMLAGADPNVAMFDMSEFSPDAEDSRANMLLAEILYRFAVGVATRVRCSPVQNIALYDRPSNMAHQEHQCDGQTPLPKAQFASDSNSSIGSPIHSARGQSQPFLSSSSFDTSTQQARSIHTYPQFQAQISAHDQPQFNEAELEHLKVASNDLFDARFRSRSGSTGGINNETAAALTTIGAQQLEQQKEKHSSKQPRQNSKQANLNLLTGLSYMPVSAADYGAKVASAGNVTYDTTIGNSGGLRRSVSMTPTRSSKLDIHSGQQQKSFRGNNNDASPNTVNNLTGKSNSFGGQTMSENALTIPFIDNYSGISPRFSQPNTRSSKGFSNSSISASVSGSEQESFRTGGGAPTTISSYNSGYSNQGPRHHHFGVTDSPNQSHYFAHGQQVQQFGSLGDLHPADNPAVSQQSRLSMQSSSGSFNFPDMDQSTNFSRDHNNNLSTVNLRQMQQQMRSVDQPSNRTAAPLTGNSSLAGSKASLWSIQSRHSMTNSNISPMDSVGGELESWYAEGPSIGATEFGSMHSTGSRGTANNGIAGEGSFRQHQNNIQGNGMQKSLHRTHSNMSAISASDVHPFDETLDIDHHLQQQSRQQYFAQHPNNSFGGSYEGTFNHNYVTQRNNSDLLYSQSHSQSAAFSMSGGQQGLIDGDMYHLQNDPILHSFSTDSGNRQGPINSDYGSTQVGYGGNYSGQRQRAKQALEGDFDS